MIKNLSVFSYDIFNIKYDYTKDNDDIITITSKLDINSIYGNSTTVAQSIYNLVYDYYNNIYTYYLNDTNTDDTYNIYYYENITFLYATLQENNAMNMLKNSDFYESVYCTLISLEKNNKNNYYISESVKLVNELYFYYSIGHYELKKN